MCRVFQIDPLYLPSPVLIIAELQSSWLVFAQATAITMTEAVLGFVLGAFTGFIIGALLANFRWARISFYPYIIGFRAIPLIAIAPLLILWFGDGISSKVIMAAIMGFFPVTVNVSTGLRVIDNDLIQLFRSYDSSRWNMFLKLQVPCGMPYFLSSLKIATTYVVLGAIVSEIFGSKEGIGFIILISTYHENTVRIFSAIFVVAVASSIFFAVMAFIEKIILKKMRQSILN